MISRTSSSAAAPRGAARVAVLLGSLSVALCGCGGGERYAPVTGTVSLNGKPLADAKLVFEPIGDESGVAAGKPSYGRTDDSGRYSLNCPIAQAEGAAVGEHRVRIVTTKGPEWSEKEFEEARAKLQREEKAGGSSDAVSDEQVREYLSDRVPPTTMRESLPARYNAETELTFTVPPEGTAAADFDLKVP